MALDAFALILSMFAVGYFFARQRILPDNAADVLNRVVLYLCFPAAILLYLPRLHLSAHVFTVALTPWFLSLVAWGLLWLANRRFKFDRSTYAALLLCVMLGNTGFIGYPMVRSLAGEGALGYAVVYDQFGNGLILSTIGMFICVRYGGGTQPSFRQMVRRILFFPPTIALILALTIVPENPPAFIAHGLKSLADALLPLVMLAVGLSLRFQLPGEHIRALAIGLLLKLILLPALVLACSLAAGITGDMLSANVLEAAMPTMITVGVLAIAYNLAPRLATAMVGYGIILSMLTVPLWSWVVKLVA